jgi:hypothetical protein
MFWTIRHNGTINESTTALLGLSIWLFISTKYTSDWARSDWILSQPDLVPVRSIGWRWRQRIRQGLREIMSSVLSRLVCDRSVPVIVSVQLSSLSPRSSTCATLRAARNHIITLAYLHTVVAQISGHHHHSSGLHRMELRCYRSPANSKAVRDGIGK